ncbi:hypothetical protein ABKV19_025545 [Rosa sericea]
MEMEQLHAAALAYYKHGSPELQGLAWSFFQSMDTNGDKRISYSEFNDFLDQSGHRWILNDPNFFKKLDRNRDGGLDFEEVITVYYIIKTRRVMCRGCSVYLCGLYFTCVACFDGADQNTYDLCPVCYRNWNFNHNHSYFLANHIVLLRAKRCTPPPPASCLIPVNIN